MVILNLTAEVVEEYNYKHQDYRDVIVIKCYDIEIARQELPYTITGYGDDNHETSYHAAHLLKELFKSKTSD